MKHLSLLPILLLLVITIRAQEYSIAHIPVALVKGANVIKRNELLEITIISPGKALKKHSYAYTILNDKADDWAEFTTYYNRFVSVEEIEGRLIDALGKELKKVKKKDISDLSSEEGMSVSDTRYKTHSFYHKDYPYTVEYTVYQEINGLFTLPGWVPQLSPSMAVQKSMVVIKAPASYQLRYKAYNFSGAVKESTANGVKVYEWQAENIMTHKTEPLMPGWGRSCPRMAFAPSEYEIEGYKGKMSSWKDFGAFIYQLTKNRDALPPQLAQKAKELTAGVTDNNKKIEILYKYLQDNTRYISVQLGIGGWQTIPAEKVAQNGYGDCKALTNYMAALLREVGILSKYTIINSDDDGLYTDVDFVSNQFDHVILCVPMKKDTVWLECTSNILPAGYLGDFTYNRPALLIDETGGTIVRTPNYRKNENLQVRNVEAVVEENGNLKARSLTRYTGLQQAGLQRLVRNGSRDNIMKAMRGRFDLPTYDVVDVQFKEEPGRIPALTETIDLTVTGYAQVSGKRLFVVPNVLTRSGIKLAADSARHFDIELDYDYLDTDTVNLRIPEGYEIESMPKPVNVQFKFGAYSNAFSFENNMISYTRMVQQNQGRYPPADYKELSDFYQAIYKSDRVKIVLKKKE
jgi:hypothetical protein